MKKNILVSFIVVSLVGAVVFVSCSGDKGKSLFDSSNGNEIVQDDANEEALPESDDPAENIFEGFPQARKESVVTITSERTTNNEAPIPPQCYTKTEQKFNPCYTCHQVYPRVGNAEYRMNKLDDGHLQGSYDFSDEGMSNHWNNLFEDRSEWVNAISDETILRYINRENYSKLASKLENNGWQGFVPDLENYQLAQEAFDENGLARDGSGWVAYSYKPFPSTFWPTNGSTDDVLIRLPEAFRTLEDTFSRDVYFLNLSIVEMTIKDLESIDIFPVNESLVNRDLNGDSVISGQVSTLVSQNYYLGDASDVSVIPQQFPYATEFMHSVRYVGVDGENIVVPPRMKELRYMLKIRELSDQQLDNRYWRERKEKLDGLLPSFVNHHDKGFENDFGWLVQGFIEDDQGELRPQSFEEGMFCMGCHANIGTTVDQTFSFGRKVTGVAGWKYIDLKGMQDAPSYTSIEPEILEYLKRVGGGNEFRENTEMQARWFNEDGSVKESEVQAADVYTLITPSPERALRLNKAYTHIVRHQDYIYGRDATIEPATNVFEQIGDQEPLTTEFRYFGWDQRLDW